MIRPMEKELIFPNVEPSMLASGLRISRMERENKLGLMKPSILESTKMARNTERANSCGQMIVPMKATFSKTTSMASVNINGKTDAPMKDNGKITKCRVKVHLPGQTEGNTLETMFKTESKASEYSLSKTEEYMKVSGLTENNMEEESLKKKCFTIRSLGKWLTSKVARRIKIKWINQKIKKIKILTCHQRSLINP